MFRTYRELKKQRKGDRTFTFGRKHVILNERLKNIRFRQADLVQLPDALINSCESISSLHIILLEDYDLKGFSYVSDSRTFFENAPVTQQLIDTNFGCRLAVEFSS